MRKNDKKAFTLIELIAVLVILAVIALIVTPLVLNIIKSAKKSANERSVDEYGKSVELAAASYLLDTGKKANSFDALNVEYSGNEVKCNVREVYKNNVFLSQCSVNGKEVKNAKTSDGYYHYGDATKFVDMYGDAVKKAIVRYQKDNKKMPTSLSELAINAEGLNVSCNSSKINQDNTVYLSNCSVGNIEVKDQNTADGWYHYESLARNYLIGDIVNYNNIKFYVIENVDDKSDTVHLLKAEPLTVAEVNQYGLGHINRYTNTSVGTAYNWNGYGGMAYYTSATCGYVNNYWVETGCTTDYAQSEMKYVVDAWAKDKFQASDLSVDSTGYSARLITYDELINNLGYNNATWNEGRNDGAGAWDVNLKYTPNWIYNINYWYWTMSPDANSALKAWYMGVYGSFGTDYAYKYVDGVVRPVVNIKISALRGENK